MRCTKLNMELEMSKKSSKSDTWIKLSDEKKVNKHKVVGIERDGKQVHLQKALEIHPIDILEMEILDSKHNLLPSTSNKIWKFGEEEK